MKVLVIGATGAAGREIIAQGMNLGHEMTAFIRSDCHRDFPKGTQQVRGDIMSTTSLEIAVEGHQAIISALGTRQLRPTTLLSEGTRNLIYSMKTVGVKRFICITGVGAGDSYGHGGFLCNNILYPFLLKNMYADKNRQESIIRRSELDWTVIRPALLTNGPRTERYRVLNDLTGIQMKRISRSDVAHFIISMLDSPESKHTTYNITY